VPQSGGHIVFWITVSFMKKVSDSIPKFIKQFTAPGKAHQSAENYGIL
jgi:hypothetical protein